jgi:integrase
MPGYVEESGQLALFDGGPDVARLKKEAARLGQSAYSASTKRAYARCWNDFEEWCSDYGRVPLPAKPGTLELFIVDKLRTLALSSVEQAIAAVMAQHDEAGFESPYTRSARDVMRGARRERGTSQKARAALTPASLRKICRALKARQVEGDARSRALMTLGFAAALRVSELVALDVSDVRFVPKGMAVTVRRGKTDQEGRGRVAGVFYGTRAYSCPVRSLKLWLRWRGKHAGPLFPGDGASGRLTTRGFCGIVKRLVPLAGLDPKDYGTHSLRAGFVTAAAEAHMDAALIMQRTGHRSVQTVAKYVRPVSIFQTDALARAL